MRLAPGFQSNHSNCRETQKRDQQSFTVLTEKKSPGPAILVKLLENMIAQHFCMNQDQETGEGELHDARNEGKSH